MSFPFKADRREKLLYRYLLLSLAVLIFVMPVHSTLEHHFLYFPSTEQEATPAAVGLAYEEVVFTATDGNLLNGWLVYGQPGAPVVLFCMGNAGNISHRLETLLLLHELGVAVFIFNYRGYGKSPGKTSEVGTYDDISGAMEFLNKRGWPARRTVILGRSLGAAIGLEGALRYPPAGLIMESAFTSIAAMGHHHYPVLNLLLGWLISAKYDNQAKIARLTSPLLIIHGENDTVCLPHMAQELFIQAHREKQLLWIPGAGHNDGFIVGREIYREALFQAIRGWTGFSMQVGT